MSDKTKTAAAAAAATTDEAAAAQAAALAAAQALLQAAGYKVRATPDAVPTMVFATTVPVTLSKAFHDAAGKGKAAKVARALYQAYVSDEAVRTAAAKYLA